MSEQALSDDTVLFRATDVVWRMTPDRVLVRHVDEGDSLSATLAESAADLVGAAALVWVALDEPASVAQIVERLGEEDLARPGAEIADVARQLVAAGWVRSNTAGEA